MNSKDALELLSDDQRRILKQFRNTVQDILQPHHDDYFLLRWLRARNFDLEKSTKMICGSFKLRKKLNADELTTDKFVEPEIYTKYTVTAPLGFDKEGCTVRYAMVGYCDFKGFVRSLYPKDALRLIIYILETDAKALAEHNRKNGLHEGRCVYIADFRAFSLRQVYDKQVVELTTQMIRIYQDCYPETLKVAYLTNVPSYFNWIWNIFKPFVDPVTMEKLKIFPTDNQSWKEEIIDIVDPEIIPAFLGGVRCDHDGDTTCQNLVGWTDKKIPSSYYLKDKCILHEDDPDVKSVVIRERSYFEHRITIEKPGSSVQWEFQTKDYNIHFGVFYEKKEFENTSTNFPSYELITVENVECHVIPETGALVCEEAGQYILHFDNKYSWFTSKHLLYKVAVTEPDDSNSEDN